MNTLLCLSDQELIAAFRGGTPGSGDELTRRYYPRVLQLSLQCLRDPHDAQDVVQEIFFKIIVRKKIAAFRGEAQLWTWLYRITLNTCRTHLVKKQKTKYIDFTACNRENHIHCSCLPAEDQALKVERRQHLENIMKQLPLKYQKALRMTCLEDRSCGEAARILKVPIPTLRVHVNRGKGMLIRLIRSRISERGSFGIHSAGLSCAA